VLPSGEDLAALARHVRETYREGCAFSAEELWCAWTGSAPSAEELEGFEDALRSSPEFSPHPARLFEFVAKPREEAVEARPAFEPAASLTERIDRALPSDAGLLRKSYQPGAPHMVLRFAFPDVAGPRCRGLLEVNAAYAAIRAAFAAEAHAPYCVGKKPVPPGAEPAIELRFISPEVGSRYRSRLDEWERQIGWRLEVASTPNMSAILETARAVLASFRIRKGPSFSAGLRTVAVELERAPDPETWARLRAEFEEATGYRLEAAGSGAT
ncbi:MAG: hypothetical protein ACUVYA_18455, partial [Planctomycetota bacterium]